MGAITRSNKSGARTAENTSQVYPLATEIPQDVNKSSNGKVSKPKPKPKSKSKSKSKPKPKRKSPVSKPLKDGQKVLEKSSKSIELFLDRENIPPDLSLPKEFIDWHTPHFIKGLQYCIEKDPTLYPVVAQQNFSGFGSKEFDEKLQTADDDRVHFYWYSLVRSVIAQQVSGAAAKAIEKKFKSLFSEDEIPTAQKTREMSSEKLKSAGLSGPKVKYVEHISEVFSNPKNILCDLNFYRTASEEEIYKEVCKLKGIGIWSAKMFALFTLEEMDVFAEDDLGIARGMAKYLEQRPEVLERVKRECAGDESKQIKLKKRPKFFNKESSKRTWKPLHDVYVIEVAEKFKPYRSAFMMILWRLSSTNIEALEI
ncbi:MAG1 [Candida oxycetoniae]|uniref:MAG1 n=1 Tax=Candida oxycetoniae TaxID=497107 RepID=A0AAI9SXF1_9ASCO|nr:MAG1 [Candida oxycetoniae]KAI3404511.1 MAG1 [Candida oxycetoniae]